MDAMPKIEKQWLAFRKNHGETFHGILKYLHTYELRSGKSTPAELVLPSEFVYFSILSKLSNDFEDEIIKNAPVKMLAQIFAGTASWWASYRDSKAIYCVDRLLAEQLWTARAPSEYPTKALQLPRRGVVLEIPETTNSKPKTICIYMDNPEDKIELRIGTISDTPMEAEFVMEKDLYQYHIYAIIDLEPEFLNDALQKGMNTIQIWSEYGRYSDEFSKKYKEDLKSLIYMVINTLLYIQGNQDVVKQIHPGGKVTNKPKIAKKQAHYVDLIPPERFSVGSGYRKVIEHWERVSEASSDRGNGGTRKPHLRSAHPHLYWHGPKSEQHPVVHFLPPIPVKGKSLEEMEETLVKEYSVR